MIVVVGGGAAGAAAAFTLRSAGHEVVLLEAADDVGGRTSTVHRGDFQVEAGAIYLLNSYSHCVRLLQEAGHADQLSRWSPTTALWDGSTAHRVRYDFLPTFLTLPLLTWRDKARLLVAMAKAVVRPAPDPFETDSLARFDRGETMEDWSRGAFGDRGFEYVVRPLIEPSFGSWCRQLSVPYLQGILKRAYKARFFVLRDGVGFLARALTADVDVRVGARVERVERAGDGFELTVGDGSTLRASSVVLAVDAPTAAEVAGSVLGPDVSASLRAAPYASMAHVSLRWLEDPWPDRDEEMLLPVGEGPRDALGYIVRSGRSSASVPDGAKSVDVYFSHDFTRVADDETVAKAALAGIREICGPSADPDESEVFRFDRALGICPPGHYAAMAALRRDVPHGIELAGDYLAHLGIETAVVSGERAAQAVLAFEGRRRPAR